MGYGARALQITTGNRARCTETHTELRDSADHSAFRATGNQRRSTRGFHTVQRDGRAIDGIGATALGNRENSLAQRAADFVTDPGNWLAVEVGSGESFKHLPTVCGGVA